MKAIFPATEARLKEWMAQPEVLGVLLVGSKSHEHADRLSDDDLEVLLTDESGARLSPTDFVEIFLEGEGQIAKLIYDTQYTTLSDLRRKASSNLDLDRWPYERAGILFDRDGTVQSAIKAAATMDAEFRQLRLLHATLDVGIAARRAEKTLKRSAQASARMLLARSVKALSRILFALEWRWVPLDHWLEAELQTLQDPTQAVPKLLQGLIETEPAPLLSALAGLEELLYAEGVPRPAGRRDLFFELIHPSRASERAIHGLF